MSAPRDVSAALQRRYGAAPRRSVVMGEVPTGATVRPMGPFVELAVRRFRDGVLETWRFDPMPRLCFHAQSKRLWCLGAGFRIDGLGFHPRGGAPHGLKVVPVERARRAPTMKGQLREFRRTHNGLDPVEAVDGVLDLPRAMIALGAMEHAVYKTDRNDGDGRSEWIHPFEHEGLPGVTAQTHTQPMICTDATGTGLWFAGGTYSVIDGWLAG